MPEETAALNPFMFRAYDIRGVVGEDLTPASGERIARAYGTYLRLRTGLRRPKVAVGRDNRPSSLELQQAAIRGAMAAGCDCVDIGLALSPMLYFAVCYWKLDGGINVTGSHNPVQYNGLKLTLADAAPIAERDIQDLRCLAESRLFLSGRARLTRRSIGASYARELLARVSLARPMKVVLDTRNGTASVFAPAILKRAGCKVTRLYCESDGTFPHGIPDPEVEENVRDLSEAVLAHKADLGIALDGDGDRIGVVDEKGGRHEADELLMVLARDFLARRPGERVMMDVKSSRTLVQDIQAHGGQPVMSRTGHSLIKKQMREEGILLAGEVSGHMFFKENYYGFDDATLAALRLLEAFSKSDLPVSAHWASVPKMIKTSEMKAPCPDDKKFQIVDEVAQYFKARYPDSLTIDGIRVEQEHGWGLVRPSNTNPYLTLRFEADSQQAFDAIKSEIYAKLSEYPDVKLP
jgi:phosphomannomutase/phosphoglucomutase